MIKSTTSIRLALLLGLGLLMIALAGCSASGTNETVGSNPAPEAQAIELKPAAGGGVSQPTYSESGETPAQALTEEQQPLAASAQSEAAAPEQSTSAVSPQEAEAAPPADEPAESAVAVPTEAAPALEGPLPPVDPTIGNLAPNFSLGTLKGEPLALEDLRGKAVVLNYWVTWCVPCREEMPDIEALYQEYQDEGLVVLSVNGTKQDAMADIEQFLAEVQVSFPVLLDHSEDVYNSYRILFMPTTFFIDPHGVIQDIVLGSTDAAGFRTRVEKLVSTLN